jgi:hypothetical protein
MALSRSGPSYLAYAVTFLFIGQVWANHHAQVKPGVEQVRDRDQHLALALYGVHSSSATSDPRLLFGMVGALDEPGYVDA